MIAVGELVLDLYPAFVVAYLIDCVVRVRPAASLLALRLGRCEVVRGPRFIFAGLLPANRAYVLAPHALAPIGRGIFIQRNDATAAARYRRQNYELVPYEGTGWTLDGVSLRRGDAVLATFASASQARSFADFKRTLTAADEDTRRHLLAAARRRALRRIATARRCLTAPLRALQLLGSALLVTLFVALPIVALLGPDFEMWVRSFALAAGALYTIAMAVVVRTLRLMRRLHLEPPHGALLSLLLFPLGAAHASFQVTKALAASVDALAAAALLAPREDFTILARAELYGLDLALADDGDADWVELCEARRVALAGLLRHQAMRAEEVRRPPAPSEAAARTWCPFCLAEYRSGGGECAQCEVPLFDLDGGRPAARWSDPPVSGR